MVLDMFWTSFSQVFTIFTIADNCPGWDEPGDNKLLMPFCRFDACCGVYPSSREKCKGVIQVNGIENLSTQCLLGADFWGLKRRKNNLQRESEERQRLMNSNENADEEGYELRDTVRNVGIGWLNGSRQRRNFFLFFGTRMNGW